MYSYEEPEWPFEPEGDEYPDLTAREPASNPCTCGLLPKGMEAPGPSGWCANCQREYEAWLQLTADEFLPLEEVMTLTPYKRISPKRHTERKRIA